MSDEQQRRDRILRVETRRVRLFASGNVIRVPLGVAQRMVGDGIAEYVVIETAAVEPPESAMLPRARGRKRG